MINNEQLTKYKKELISDGVNLLNINDNELKDIFDEASLYKIRLFEKVFDFNKTKNIFIVNISQIISILKIDKALNNLLIKMVKELERKIRNDFTETVYNNSLESNVLLINEYFNKYDYVKNDIFNKRNYSISGPHINEDSISINELIEFLPFGDFIRLYNLYNKVNNKGDFNQRFLYSIKFIRNTLYHNNSLLPNIRIPYKYNHLIDKNGNKKINSFVRSKIKEIKQISPLRREKYISNPIIHDIVATFICFNEIFKDNKIISIFYKETSSFIEVLNDELNNLKLDNYLFSSMTFLKETIEYLSKN